MVIIKINFICNSQFNLNLFRTVTISSEIPEPIYFKIIDEEYFLLDLKDHLIIMLNFKTCHCWYKVPIFNRYNFL